MRLCGAFPIRLGKAQSQSLLFHRADQDQAKRDRQRDQGAGPPTHTRNCDTKMPDGLTDKREQNGDNGRQMIRVQDHLEEV